MQIVTAPAMATTRPLAKSTAFTGLNDSHLTIPVLDTLSVKKPVRVRNACHSVIRRDTVISNTGREEYE